MQEETKTGFNHGNVSNFAKDLLRGAQAIAEYTFGSAETKYRRKVYHLSATGQLPTFRMGNELCMRKSTLLRKVESREAARETAA
ncbi:MAG: DNA-binding protein [Rhodomicrobium sp.]